MMAAQITAQSFQPILSSLHSAARPKPGLIAPAWLHQSGLAIPTRADQEDGPTKAFRSTLAEPDQPDSFGARRLPAI